MKGCIRFRFGPFHVPYRTKLPGNADSVSASYDRQLLGLRIEKPTREYSHELDGNGQDSKITHAFISVLVECDLPENPQPFLKISEAVIKYVAPFIERVRARSKQPHLIPPRLEDLEIVTVQNTVGEKLDEYTKKYEGWISHLEPDTAPPFISTEDWETIREIPSDKQLPLVLETWESSIPLWESLLLDAERLLTTDSRISALYAALACEIFIQQWLERQARQSPKLKKYLDSVRERQGGNAEGGISLRGYYDLAVYLATERSLKDDAPELWETFGKLVRARDSVAHRGRLTANFNASEAVKTARSVVKWVNSLDHGDPTHSPASG